MVKMNLMPTGYTMTTIHDAIPVTPQVNQHSRIQAKIESLLANASRHW
jgi:hypothetical protein